MTIPLKIINKKDMKELPNQEQIWNNISAPWKNYVIKKIPIVEEFLEDKKGKIIDLGCGTGRNMIKNKDVEYYGVDFSAGQLKHAEKHIKDNTINAKLFKSKVDKALMSEDEMFDYGLFIATLHCLEGEEKRLSALKEFYRVLKPGAEALISVWSADDKRFEGYDKDIYMAWREGGIPYMRYYYLYDKQELLDLLENTGFEILHFYESRTHDRFSKKNWIIKIKK